MLKLPFYTTLYTMLGNKEGSVNYLGVGEYTQFWTRKYFPQFTVLTNNPREHGVLCAIIKFMSENKIEINRKSFRDYEALWGLLLTHSEECDSPLNVTKYKKFLDSQKPVSLASVKRSPHLYNTLGYGLFGFYINPTTKWGLIKKDRKTLSEEGNRLADYFLKDLKFKKLLTDWRDKKEINLVKFRDLAHNLQGSLEIKTGTAEKRIWEQVLQAYLESHPLEVETWDVKLASDQLENFLANPKTYQSFFPTLLSQFEKQNKDILAEDFKSIQFLEKALTICEFIFDFEYSRRSQTVQKEVCFELTQKDKEFLTKNYLDNARIYSERTPIKNHFPVFDKPVESYEDLFNHLLQRHIRVQDSKKKRRYMNEAGDVVSFKEINEDKIKKVLESSEKYGLLDSVIFHYRKDWYLFRFQKYFKYMR